MYVKDGTSRLKKVLVSRPQFLKPAPINEIAKKWKDTVMDVPTMLREHELFVGAYKKAGVEVEFLEPDEERPNSVFARDFGGCVKEGYIMGRFKLDMRYKEHIDYKKRMEELGIPMIGEVKEGLFEGGDFMFMNEHWVAVGMADRTNEAGLVEIKKILEPLGYEVTGVPLKKEYLHLDMCFNLVDDHLAVSYRIELDSTEILKPGGGPHCMTFPLLRG